MVKLKYRKYWFVSNWCDYNQRISVNGAFGAK